MINLPFSMFYQLKVKYFSFFFFLFFFFLSFCTLQCIKKNFASPPPNSLCVLCQWIFSHRKTPHPHDSSLGSIPLHSHSALLVSIYRLKYTMTVWKHALGSVSCWRGALYRCYNSWEVIVIEGVNDDEWVLSTSRGLRGFFHVFHSPKIKGALFSSHHGTH